MIITALCLAQTNLLAITLILLWRKVAWLEETVIRNSLPSISSTPAVQEWAAKFGRMENGYLVVDEASIRHARGTTGEA